jgi:hypothetical protein
MYAREKDKAELLEPWKFVLFYATGGPYSKGPRDSRIERNGPPSSRFAGPQGILHKVIFMLSTVDHR